MGRRSDVGRAAGFKLVLVLTPFLVVLALGMIEWLLRSRGP